MNGVNLFHFTASFSIIKLEKLFLKSEMKQKVFIISKKGK